MKKLLVLMLVLGMASVTNAMTLELQNGDADTVDVVATVGYTSGDDIYFAVAGDTSAVTISGGAMGVYNPGPVPDDSAIYGYDAQANALVAAPLDGMWGFIGAIATVGPLGPGVIVDEIMWTLVGGASSADIVLVSTADFGTFNVLDTITVPEPMTIALMGLGGLFLLRRRK